MEYESDDEETGSFVRVGVPDPLWLFNLPQKSFIPLACEDLPESLLIVGCSDAVQSKSGPAMRLYGLRGHEGDCLYEYHLSQLPGSTFATLPKLVEIPIATLYNHPILHDAAIYLASEDGGYSLIKIQRSIATEKKTSNYLQALLSGAWAQTTTEDGLPLAKLPEHLADSSYEFGGLLKLLHGIESPVNPAMCDFEGSSQERGFQCCAMAINIAILAEQLSMIELPLELYRRVGHIILSSVVATPAQCYEPSLFDQVFQGQKEPTETALKLLHEFCILEHPFATSLTLGYARRVACQLHVSLTLPLVSHIYEKHIDPLRVSYSEKRKEIGLSNSTREQILFKLTELERSYTDTYDVLLEAYSALNLVEWGAFAYADRMYNAVYGYGYASS